MNRVGGGGEVGAAAAAEGEYKGKKRHTSGHNCSNGLHYKMAAKFLWKKNGPKPESKKNTDESTWLMRYSFDTANSLEVNIKVGSRECGLNAVSDDGKISELSLKKKYS